MKHDQDVNKAAWRIACAAFGGRGGNSHYRRTMAFQDARDILEGWLDSGAIEHNELDSMSLVAFERWICVFSGERIDNFT